MRKTAGRWLGVLALALCGGGPAGASEDGIGTLRCVLESASPGFGLPEARLACSFAPNAGTPGQRYDCRVLGIGEGVRIDDDAVFVWEVLARGPARGTQAPYRGTYIAGTGTAALGNGIVARELLAAGAPGLVLRPREFSGLSGDLSGLRIQSLALK